MPPPLKNRDFVTQRSWLDLGAEKCIVNHSVNHKSMPIRKGYVRGISYVTGYLIREQGAQKCQFTYVSQSDPRGKLPAWVVNKATQYLAPKVISRIYKACQNYSTWKSSHNPGHKPWLYPEQMSLPRLDLQDIQAECEFTSNESLDESNVKEEDVLPPLPKKALLVNDKVATERRSGLEKFLTFLASSPKVCSSSLLLEFLGVNAIKAGKYTQEGLKHEASTEGDQGEENNDRESLTEGGSKSGLFDEEDEDTEDLFNEEQEEEPEIVTEMTARHVTSSDTKLFDYPVISGDVGDEEDFFQEKEEQIQDPISTTPGQGEDNSDLLSVQDDLDELFLDQSKSKRDDNNGSPIKSKPALKPRPSKSLSKVPPTTKPDVQPKPKHGTKPDLKPKPSS